MTSGQSKTKSIWEGVYQSFDDVPVSAPVFNDELWVTKQHTRIKQVIENYRSGTIVSRDYPLPAVIAMILPQTQNLSMIDFGGGMGQSYFEILCKVPGAKDKITCTVVETKAVIENLAPELSSYPNLRFVDDYADADDSADLIHIGSTLQYIDDWQGLITAMAAKFKPQTFVLSDLLVGNIPSFVTAQSYYDRIIGARFINEQEFRDYWNSLGYDLAFRSDYQPIEGDDYFPNHALPKTHRIKRACHMVYTRKAIAQ